MTKKHIKRCSASLIIRGKHIRSTRCPLTLVRLAIIKKKKKKKNTTEITNVGEDVEKRELSYSVNGNVNWCS